jgi:hypothetical protein
VVAIGLLHRQTGSFGGRNIQLGLASGQIVDSTQSMRDGLLGLINLTAAHHSQTDYE